jgi:CRISPR-associated exonuclease Cas4
VYPVEYKHGPKRKWLNDDLQLAGQALCLEEMLARLVPCGAIYHVSSRRRRQIEITAELQRRVEETAATIRAMVHSGVLPPPLNDARCRGAQRCTSGGEGSRRTLEQRGWPSDRRAAL